MGWTPPPPPLSSLDYLLVLVRGFPRLKAKPVDIPARDSHIRQNNIIDSRTLANQLLSDQNVSPSLCPWRFPFPPQLRPSKTTNTSFWNAVKVPEVPLLSRPLRPRPREEGKREVAVVAWPVSEVWRRFARWGSSEMPSPTVSENETALSDISDCKILISQFSIRPYCVYIFFSFQKLVGLQEAGLCFVLSGRSNRLPHCGSASPFPRLLLGVYRCGSFCSPPGEPTDFPPISFAA